MCRIALVLLCLASFPAGSSGQSLTQVGVIDVPGPKGQRFDYLTMDDEDHYLLSGGNHTFTVVALDSQRALAHFPLPAGADVVKYDSGPHRAYAACASGFISIVQEDDPAHFHKVEDFPVQKLVHSLTIDAATHRLYVPEQQEDGKPVARIVIYKPVNPESP